mmetsp:Transcript_32345/g.78322  ORF Transcript_32345/g.78322 Transcript_32345/m.78322 type:complete len:1238 (-) Transcript_32345:93-3806(-)
MMSGQPPVSMSTDTRLLMASLDNEAVEDEAEATLLDVLERRQVSFANQDLVAPRPSRRHRRGRGQSIIAGGLPSIDLLNLGSTRPSSAPSPSEAAQSSSRPGLPRRSISHGRSRRNLPRPALISSLTGRAATFDWAMGGRSSSELSDLHGLEVMLSDSPKGYEDEGKESAERLSRSKTPEYIQQMHYRARSGFPAGVFDHVISDSSQSSGPHGLTTSGEKARSVALTMKTLAANNAEETAPQGLGDGHLPDLMNIIEAQRENDDQKSGGGGSYTGSIRKHGGDGSHRTGEGASKSRESRSRMSRSAENQSRGGSSGFSSNGRGFRGRPFSGVISSNPFSSDGGFMSNVDQMFQAAEHVQELCQIPEGEEGEGTKYTAQSSAVLAHENANFLSQIAASHPEVPPASWEGAMEGPMEVNAVFDEQTPMLQNRPRLSPRRYGYTNSFGSFTQGSRFYKILSWWADLRKSMRMFAVAFDVPYVKGAVWDFFLNEVPMFIVPALAVSAFFFYQLDNPPCRFLPTDASISWWILFVVRHFLTYKLAYVAEYVLIDVMATRSLISVKLIGPLATLYAVNAKGWPFILNAWGLLNMLLIQEGQANHTLFHSHWLYFSDIEIFSAENSSGGVAQSATYKNILLSCNIAGVATCLKRTILALYLGKRIFIHYKPKLEKVMQSMILLTDVADLGNAIDDFEFERVENRESKKSISGNTSTLQDKIRVSTMIEAVKKQDDGKIDSDAEEGIIDEESKATNESTAWNRLRSESNSSDEHEPVEIKASHEFDKTLEEKKDASQHTNSGEYLHTEELPAMDNGDPPINSVHEPVRGLLQDVSTTTQIKSLLDGFEEPVNKQDRMADPSIHDILRFRTAIRFLDDSHPFGSSFGPAFTRDSCIKSAKSLYTRLLALSPGSPALHFDIIGVLAYNIDGTFDDKKARSLVRLFRPDKFDEVSLLHFVQSCDGVYRKLRYLRASVGNSTLIDSVLENIFNGIFFFFLALIIMSVMKLNPWTLLVSLSTVLVSFAFALGPSAAKLIEGMIMIAVRRPYDLGDRIAIVQPTGAPDDSGDPGYHDTWFVEDVNLFTTTLRLSRTNEISTVNNGSIANTRIVNHGRSLNALVNIELPMSIEVLHDQVQIVQSALQQYIRDNPRVWACLVNFRITKVEPFNGLIVYSARVQHVKSWQDLLPVMQARGELEKFCTEILFKLGIHFESYTSHNNVYIKEFPEQELLPDEAIQSEGSAEHHRND